MKRTFLAIPIKPGKEFEALSDSLKDNLTHEKLINWCRSDIIHLTLKFVGETQDHEVPEIIDAVQKVAMRHHPFAMDFDRVGLFGSNGTPRVLWMGMKDEPKALYDLESDLLDAFDEIGFLRDRQNFVPHLTVCRIKNLTDKKFFQQIYNAIEPKTFIHTDVNELVYYQSFLQPTGPYYKPLKRIPLAAAKH